MILYCPTATYIVWIPCHLKRQPLCSLIGIPTQTAEKKLLKVLAGDPSVYPPNPQRHAPNTSLPSCAFLHAQAYQTHHNLKEGNYTEYMHENSVHNYYASGCYGKYFFYTCNAVPPVFWLLANTGILLMTFNFI